VGGGGHRHNERVGIQGAPAPFSFILHTDYMNLCHVIPCHVDLRHLIDQRRVNQPMKSTVANTAHAQSAQVATCRLITHTNATKSTTNHPPATSAATNHANPHHHHRHRRGCFGWYDRQEAGRWHAPPLPVFVSISLWWGMPLLVDGCVITI